MSRQAKWFLWLAVACFSLLAIAGWSQSSATRNYRQDVEYYDKKCAAERLGDKGERSKECQSFLYRATDDPVSLATFVLVIATVGLFGATFLLWRATVTMVRGSDNTALRQLRAYVLAEMAEVDRKKNEIWFTATNTGQTPALKARARLNWHWEGGLKDIPDDFTYPDKPGEHRMQSVTNIGRDRTQRYSFHMPSNELAVVSRGESWIFCYGYVKYEDVFGGEHISRFCYKVRPGRTPDENSFTIWGPHNDAT